jgi:hypothetical protein
VILLTEHGASCRYVLLANQETEQGVHGGEWHPRISNRLHLYCRSNPGRLEHALGDFGVVFDSIDPQDDQFAVGNGVGRMKQLLSRLRVFLAHENLEPETTPRQMIAHAARSVGLNKSIKTSGLEDRFGQVRFYLRSEGLQYNKLAVAHVPIIQRGAAVGFCCFTEPAAVWEESGFAKCA